MQGLIAGLLMKQVSGFASESAKRIGGGGGAIAPHTPSHQSQIRGGGRSENHWGRKL